MLTTQVGNPGQNETVDRAMSLQFDIKDVTDPVEKFRAEYRVRENA
ncbi:hypothetical protein J4734_16800 [Klebsiella pneumoniae]|uniref:Uncharacterized protein n=1 Tax=Klebsiella pneumoniae TaxID=573 RepID=A0A939NN81_KLEPN|nr:hypothetical protein [Klebsiella pneumoniae]